MDQHQQTLRVGAAAVVCALVLRLLSGGALEGVVTWLRQPENQSFLIYLETGRILRLDAPREPDAEFHAGESPAPVWSPEDDQPPTFTAADAEALEIRYSCSYRPDISALLTQPLQWDLRGSEPTVLIVHTHTTESYTKSPGESYEESASFRTLDEAYNMISVGDRVAQLLTQQGITVIHDRSLHDYPSYNGSYGDARTAIRGYLEKYPTIRLVLDLHRDASGDIDNQLRTHATVDGKDSAQLMLVIGTNASGRTHPNWEQNLSLGLKLHTQWERICPGITRPLTLREQRFNQDLLSGALIIEVGAAGNTHAEALIAADILAQGIASLAQGSGAGS